MSVSYTTPSRYAGEQPCTHQTEKQHLYPVSNASCARVYSCIYPSVPCVWCMCRLTELVRAVGGPAGPLHAQLRREPPCAGGRAAGGGRGWAGSHAAAIHLGDASRPGAPRRVHLHIASGLAPTLLRSTWETHHGQVGFLQGGRVSSPAPPPPPPRAGGEESSANKIRAVGAEADTRHLA
jgi:hypothetical protein